MRQEVRSIGDRNGHLRTRRQQVFQRLPSHLRRGMGLRAITRFLPSCRP